MAGQAHDHDHPGLDVRVERTGPCVASVHLSVTGDEFQGSRRESLQHIARRTRLKGFRPGKVPPAMIERQYGAEIDRDVVEHLVRHAYETAVRDGELRPATQPRIDLESVRPPVRKEGDGYEDWEHEFEILLRPEIELGRIEGIEVESRPIEIDDEELDAAAEDLGRQLSRPEPAGDEGLPADGMAVCRLEFLREGGEEPVLDRDGIRLSPKTAPRGIDAEAFEAALTGAAAGTTHELPIAFPEDFPVEDARGEQGTCRLTVSEAYRIVAPSVEELVERLGVEPGEDEAPDQALRAELRKRLEASKREAEDRRVESALLDRLIEEHPMELPEPLVSAQVESRVAELRQGLEGQGLEPAEVEARLAEERKQAFEATSRAMKAVYLMEEIARARDLQVGDQDIEGELRSIAKRNGVELAEVRKYYREQGLVQQLALELLERKVRSFLREKADIRVA